MLAGETAVRGAQCRERSREVLGAPRGAVQSLLHHHPCRHPGQDTDADSCSGAMLAGVGVGGEAGQGPTLPLGSSGCPGLGPVCNTAQASAALADEGGS